MDCGCLLSFLFMLCGISTTASAVNLEDELFRDLMKGYNKNIRPMEQSGDITKVYIKMTLTNLISLSEKEEALTTNVWIEMQWCDYRLRWDQAPRSALYGDITHELRIPSKRIWLPDVILENNVDGQFEVALYCNALVSPNGCVYWLPPAIYRSACPIVVNYFPFDWQNCSMVFRSETYSANEVELYLKEEDNHTLEWVDIDPEAFTENGEWAIKHRPAKKLINPLYTKDDLQYQEVVFFLIIQRKPLFYIINIIAPCVLFSSLGLLVFFLPAKAGGQKCTMSITTLLGQTVFLFLIAKKVPETSKAVPLIGKYLMFVISFTTMVVMNCVVVLNVSLRTPNTHKMSDRVRRIFLNILPRLLRMQMKPWTPDGGDSVGDWAGGKDPHRAGNGADRLPCHHQRRRSSMGLMVKAEEYVLKTARTELMFSRLRERQGLIRTVFEKLYGDLEDVNAEKLENSLATISPELKQCVASCKHIAETAQGQNRFQNENEEWFLLARVIDRVCFIVMALIFSIGTVGIFLMGHFNQPPSMPFPGDPRRFLPPLGNMTGVGTGAEG
ncbi:acetylcholine receptor subunit gamma [Gadus chalcogrammus]|uniref:acetylcholine receptor subunit gamma n=1 Tax=Gadus chalcogrammus TaxID=1042646 RepID=UPI0024C4D1DB|nr:acetylcholine receptor subunit gamma [Gadus chalcogrammus]